MDKKNKKIYIRRQKTFNFSVLRCFLLNKLKAIERHLSLHSNKFIKTCISIRLSINNVVYHISFYIRCSFCSAPCHYVMSHERRGCIAHHDILHQRPGPSWDQPVQMDFGFAGHPHYKICYRLPIANPDHSEYLGHCPAKPYKFPTIMALQAEFNEIMERRNLSHI
ncbi:unnamed protein product [Rhizophagus irregularis]|nr:unnamed protein product [Rhizophagus irregularis]